MPADRLYLMKEKLDQCVGPTIVTGLVKYFSDQPISEGYQKYEQWINQINLSNSQWKNIYRECVIASPNWLMKTDELRAIGGFDQLTYPEDYDLVFRWYQHRFEIKTMNHVTLFWREHPDRTSRNSNHYDQEHFFNLKIRRFIELDWNSEPVILWGNNIKTQLCSQVFKAHDIPFQKLIISNYQSIEDHADSQLLVSVYPEPEERNQMEGYLKKINRHQGKDWWYV